MYRSHHSFLSDFCGNVTTLSCTKVAWWQGQKAPCCAAGPYTDHFYPFLCPKLSIKRMSACLWSWLLLCQIKNERGEHGNARLGTISTKLLLAASGCFIFPEIHVDMLVPAVFKCCGSPASGHCLLGSVSLIQLLSLNDACIPACTGHRLNSRSMYQKQ